MKVLRTGFRGWCRCGIMWVLAGVWLASACGPAERKPGSPDSGADSLAVLASVPGADMTFYHLYEKQLADGAREAASASAETFLNGMDSLVADPVAARMAVWLSAYYSEDRNQFSVGARWGERALRMYRELGLPDKVAAVSCRLGKSYREINRFDLALYYVLPALAYFEERQDLRSALPCYNLLGQIYHFCREPETSLDYFERYETAARELGDTLHLVYALNNLAMLTGAPQDTLRRHQLLRESARLAREYGDTLAYFTVWQSMLSSYVNANETEKLVRALPLLEQVPSVAENLRDRIKYFYSVGAINYRLGRLEEAAGALESAIACCRQGEFDYFMQSCYYMLQGVYRRMGDIGKAYDALQHYTSLYRKTLSLESYLQLFKYQNELMLSQERDRMTERRNRVRLTGISLGFALLLALALAWAALWRQRFKVVRQKSELENRRLQQENREQEIKAQQEILELRRMQQFQLDRIVQEVVGQLQRIGRKYPDLPVRGELEAICSNLQPENDEQWKELNRYVPEFNSEFFQKLLQDYPDLTINERRLCALLNMNLTTKEISEITRQSVHSINIARGRLRSKLGIIGERMTIQEFLAKYN